MRYLDKVAVGNKVDVLLAWAREHPDTPVDFPPPLPSNPTEEEERAWALWDNPVSLDDKGLHIRYRTDSGTEWATLKNKEVQELLCRRYCYLARPLRHGKWCGSSFVMSPSWFAMWKEILKIRRSERRQS